jgi:glycosyltransferase involved in cell wall biosynthesis
MPLVSVICATYDRGPAIRATIDSVLAQTRGDLELLVVSDGSTDDTDAAVREASRADGRVRLIRVEHSGIPSRAMNTGIAAAAGEVIAYIDHDDMWTPDHLDVLLAQLDDGADVAAAGSVWVDPEGRVLSVRPSAALFWHHEIQVTNPVFENSQAAHRADWTARVGPWREDPLGLEDWDMWLRLADAGARFRTVERRTVRKTMARTNRHRRLRSAHALELAAFPDAPRARRALAALLEPAVVEEIGRASAADLLAWYERLSETDGFVFPLGFAPDRPAARRRLPSALAEAREADRGLEDPVHLHLAPRAGGGVALVQDVNCMTADHAARYRATVLTAHPGLFEIVARVCAPFDGVVHDEGNRS